MKEERTRASLDRKRELFALAAVTCLYLAVIGGHSYSTDGMLIYRQALSIAQNFSFHFAVPVYWGGGPLTTSISGLGLALLYVPSVFVATRLGLHPPVPASTGLDFDLLYRDPVYAIAGSPIHIVIAVATGFLVVRFVRALGFGTTTALLALAGLCIASPEIVYARGDFPQPALGLWLVAGFLAAQLYLTSNRRLALIAGGGALVLAVLTRQAEGSLLFPVLLFMVVPNLRPLQWNRRVYADIAIVTGSYLIAVAFTLLVNYGRFGSLTSTGGYAFYWTTPPWIGIPGVLVSPSRGILWQFPLIVLAPLGVRRLWSTPYKKVAIAASAVVAVLFFNTALWLIWWGGWSWGSRLFVPAWPIVAVFSTIGAASLRQSLRTWLTLVLFAGGVLWALPGTFTDLLGGYAGAYDGTHNSFLLSGYPPIGAWQFLHHLRAANLSDSSAVDIVWFRIARYTANLSLLVPVALGFAAAALAWRAIGPGLALAEGEGNRHRAA